MPWRIEQATEQARAAYATHDIRKERRLSHSRRGVTGLLRSLQRRRTLPAWLVHELSTTLGGALDRVQQCLTLGTCGEAVR
jgi:hypothetical protein